MPIFRSPQRNEVCALFRSMLRRLPHRPATRRPGRSREIRTQMPPLQEVPLPGSYRLRRHFPRLCDFIARVPAPVSGPIYPKNRSQFGIRRLRISSFQGFDTFQIRPSAPERAQKSTILFRTVNFECVRRRGLRIHSLLPLRRTYYQLAFVTPGIRPLEAISRNWIRLMPNRRI